MLPRPVEPIPPRRTLSPGLVRVLVGLLSLIWGSTWLVIAEGLRDLPPLTSAGLRFSLAFCVMLVIAPWLARREGGVAPRPMLWITVGCLNFAASYGIVYTTETVLPSGLVSVLWAVFPLMMAGSGHFFLHERLRRTQVAGFTIGFLGILMLFATDLGSFGEAAIPIALLLFVSPLVSAVGQTVVKRSGEATSAALLNRNAMGLGAVLLVTGAILTEHDAPIVWTPSSIGSIVYLALIGTCLTFSLYFWLLRYASASRLSVVAYLTPMIALFLGWLIRDEPLTGTIAVGAALVIGGVVLVGL